MRVSWREGYRAAEKWATSVGRNSSWLISRIYPIDRNPPSAVAQIAPRAERLRSPGRRSSISRTHVNRLRPGRIGKGVTGPELQPLSGTSARANGSSPLENESVRLLCGSSIRAFRSFARSNGSFPRSCESVRRLFQSSKREAHFSTCAAPKLTRPPQAGKQTQPFVRREAARKPRPAKPVTRKPEAFRQATRGGGGVILLLSGASSQCDGFSDRGRCVPVSAHEQTAA